MTATRPIRSLADIEAIERELPFEQRVTQQSSYEMVREAASRYPERPALIFLPTGSVRDAPITLSYAQFVARLTQTANLMHSLGLDASGAVSYLLPNLPQTYMILWGAAAATAVNPVNPLLSAAQIAEIMQAADSRVLITLGPGTELWDKSQAALQLLPYPVTLLKIGGGDTDEARDFDQALAAQACERLIFDRSIRADDVAAYFHTGGTTGSPKLVRHTHRNQVYQAWVNRLLFPLGPEDKLMVGAPLFHVAAVYCWGLAPLVAGACVILLSPSGFRNPVVIQDYWKNVERFKATMGGAVPTVVSALLAVPKGDADISSLTKMMCGAAPLSVEVFRAFERATGVPVLEGYGLTEATALTTANPRDGEKRVGSIGIRVPYTRVKTVRLDAEGNYLGDCRAEEIGVVAIEGPTVTPGYRQDKHNKGAFFGEHWLNTGDLGRIDRDGYVWLTGRAKDLIIRGGHNISPTGIEEALHQHPAVALAAAVGRPDGYAGEIPVAYVVLKPGATVAGEALKAFAHKRVPEPPAAPAAVHVIEVMPMTAVGKIYKPTLRYDAAKRGFEAALEPLGLACSVAVGPDEVHGTLARIRLESSGGDRSAAVQAIGQALAGFTLRHEVT
jgi:fatty-acyl-CoA synthase